MMGDNGVDATSVSVIPPLPLQHPSVNTIITSFLSLHYLSFPAVYANSYICCHIVERLSGTSECSLDFFFPFILCCVLHFYELQT